MVCGKICRITRVLVCVAVAGVLFITGVYYGCRLLFIPGAFFDWLPLPMGWMRLGGGSRTRRAGLVHGIVTIVAYVFGILWFIHAGIYGIDTGLVFLEIWFLAVLLGAYTTAEALIEGR